jgi:hypothetical protein
MDVPVALILVALASAVLDSVLPEGFQRAVFLTP